MPFRNDPQNRTATHEEVKNAIFWAKVVLVVLGLDFGLDAYSLYDRTFRIHPEQERSANERHENKDAIARERVRIDRIADREERLEKRLDRIEH